MSIEEIKGFLVVPVQIPLSKHYKTKSNEILHYIYFKKQQSQDKDLSERSLFIINPPLNSSLSKFKEFFQSVSPSSIVENYFLNDEGLDYDINLTNLTSDLYKDDNNADSLRLPNQTALISFVDKSAANLAFNKLKKYLKSNEYYKWENNKDKPASVRFLETYHKNQLNIEETAQVIDQALADFDAREQKSMNELQQMGSIVDEDGFTLVVGKNRKTKREILGKIDKITKYKTKDTENKMKRKEKADFYRFQVREKKKVEMNELLRKFKDDQEKIKLLKEKKKFRPY